MSAEEVMQRNSKHAILPLLIQEEANPSGCLMQ